MADLLGEGEKGRDERERIYNDFHLLNTQSCG